MESGGYLTDYPSDLQLGGYAGHTVAQSQLRQEMLSDFYLVSQNIPRVPYVSMPCIQHKLKRWHLFIQHVGQIGLPLMIRRLQQRPPRLHWLLGQLVLSWFPASAPSVPNSIEPPAPAATPPIPNIIGM